MSKSIWIIYRKLDKAWAYAHNGEPGAIISEECALKSLNKPLDEIVWHIKDECSEYIVWKFEI